ncbi:MAG: hypothetical protein LBV67_07150 [Streptococcaceae bacterium]|jgi:hypothetical protein|nr:hypothetical protein [Streptococcaceae bacterium]
MINDERMTEVEKKQAAADLTNAIKNSDGFILITIKGDDAELHLNNVTAGEMFQCGHLIIEEALSDMQGEGENEFIED